MLKRRVLPPPPVCESLKASVCECRWRLNPELSLYIRQVFYHYTSSLAPNLGFLMMSKTLGYCLTFHTFFLLLTTRKFCVYDWLACTYVCVPHGCLVPKEIKRGGCQLSSSSSEALKSIFWAVTQRQHSRLACTRPESPPSALQIGVFSGKKLKIFMRKITSEEKNLFLRVETCGYHLNMIKRLESGNLTWLHLKKNQREVTLKKEYQLWSWREDGLFYTHRCRFVRYWHSNPKH